MGGRGSKSGFDKLEKTIDEVLGIEKGKGSVKEINTEQFGNLYETEDKIRGRKREVLVVFDREGKAVKAYQGDAVSVKFPANEAKNWKGYTVTHNHPQGKAGFGGTFSYADMRSATIFQFGSHRAVAAGQGEHNYILIPRNNANHMGLNRRIAKDIPRLDFLMKGAVREVRNEYANGQYKNEEHAVHVARQRAVGILNNYYRNVTAQYGFVYRTQK